MEKGIHLMGSFTSQREIAAFYIRKFGFVHWRQYEKHYDSPWKGENDAHDCLE